MSYHSSTKIGQWHINPWTFLPSKEWDKCSWDHFLKGEGKLGAHLFTSHPVLSRLRRNMAWTWKLMPTALMGNIREHPRRKTLCDEWNWSKNMKITVTTISSFKYQLPNLLSLLLGINPNSPLWALEAEYSSSYVWPCHISYLVWIGMMTILGCQVDYVWNEL